jgi:hypothetical protein
VSSRQRVREWALYLNRETVGWMDCQHVSDVRKGDEAFDFVKSVDALVSDVQEEIDLCCRKDPDVGGGHV